MRIACISDLHLSDEANDQSNYNRLNDFLYNLKDYSVDHLIICGDIVAQYDDPNGSYDFDDLRDLLKYYEWYDSLKCTLVPGNHDVRYMGNFPSNARTIRQRFPKLFQGPAIYNQIDLIITKVIKNVVIIGLDTVTKNPTSSLSTGWVGADQLEELKRLLNLSASKEKYVIIAMHHGPYKSDIFYGHLNDYDEFWEVVKGSPVDLIVHGHGHESYEEGDESVDAICVGGFMHDDGECLIIDIDEEKNGIDTWWLDVEE